MLHLSGITPALSASCARAVERAIELARATDALVCFDPNVRPSLWPDAAECRRVLLALMARADLVMLGHEDAEALFPGLDEDAVTRAAGAGRVSTVVLKLGERGALARRGEEVVRVPVHRVEGVIDTVGAGDGFDAGFVAGQLRGLPLADALALGARVGAGAVAVAGDWEGYPYAAELGL